jgi:hypothetical protein
MRLKKRAKAKKETVRCVDDDGTEKQVPYTRFAYPGASDWPLTSIQAREAIVSQDADSCTEAEVHEREATAEDLQPGENNSPPKINRKCTSVRPKAKRIRAKF